MSGRQSLVNLGWRQIAPPTIPIDTTGWLAGSSYAPNVRADPYAISIWEASGGPPRHWQYWTGVDAGWSGLKAFPPDYTGPVGCLSDVSPSNNNPSFATSDYMSGVAGGTVIRVSRVFASGSHYAQDNWWPRPDQWSNGNAVLGLQDVFDGFAWKQIFAQQDPYDATQLLSFVSVADPAHVWVPFSLGWSDAVQSALLAFNPNSGSVDYVVELDVNSINEFVQNFAHPMFLYDASAGGGVNSISFHPSGNNAFGGLRFNAPFNAFQDAVIGFANFRFSDAAIVGPMFGQIDSGAPILPEIFDEARLRNPNLQSTRYFPTVPDPGFAWTGVDTLTGAQVQQYAITKFDPIAQPFGGVHDGKAVVSPFRFAGAGPPAVLGLTFTNFYQGFQGTPVDVAWPVDAVSPWYGMVWNGGVYLIDSNSPPQMFQLVMLATQFAGLYELQNWVRMGAR